MKKSGHLKFSDKDSSHIKKTLKKVHIKLHNLNSKLKFKKFLRLASQSHHLAHDFYDLLSDEDKLQFINYSSSYIEKYYSKTSKGKVPKIEEREIIKSLRVVAYDISKKEVETFLQNYVNKVEEEDITNFIKSDDVKSLYFMSKLLHNKEMILNDGRNFLHISSQFGSSKVALFLIDFINLDPFMGKVDKPPSYFAEIPELKEVIYVYEQDNINKRYRDNEILKEVVNNLVYKGLNNTIYFYVKNKKFALSDIFDELLEKSFLLGYKSNDIDIINRLLTSFVVSLAIWNGSKREKERRKINDVNPLSNELDFYTPKSFLRSLYSGMLTDNGKLAHFVIPTLLGEIGSKEFHGNYNGAYIIEETLDLIFDHKKQLKIDWTNPTLLSQLRDIIIMHPRLGRRIIFEKWKFCPFIIGDMTLEKLGESFNEYLSKWNEVISQKNASLMLKKLKEHSLSEKFNINDPAFSTLFFYLIEYKDCSKGDVLFSLLRSI